MQYMYCSHAIMKQTPGYSQWHGDAFVHVILFRLTDEFRGHVAMDRVPSVGSAMLDSLDSLAHGMASSDSIAFFLYTMKLHKESW